ncbi:MAG: PEP-CTERM sorting domain-containing protein [Deltaproteobacteria bacterium]|nr:MAG: PEP-CTERM sorting domain-containing protein [Deltaproteobacteria bacterium]
MKRIAVVFMSLVLVLALTGVASALIAFDEVLLLTSDPTIGGVSFWAGNPASWNDTYTDNSWSPLNPYLASGYDDGTGNSPWLYDTFIGATILGLPVVSVSFDILSEYQLPGGTTLWARALSGGSEVASTFLNVILGDNSYHSMSLAYAGGFDTLYIYDDLVGVSGEAFHIDNFSFTEYQQPGQVIPEPATMVLLGSGLVGGWFLKRRKKI